VMFAFLDLRGERDPWISNKSKREEFAEL
jgi:hypothetical protein